MSEVDPKLKRLITTLRLPTVIILSFISGYIFCNLINIPGHIPTNRPTRFQGNFQYINPLLECDISDFSQDYNLRKLKQAINYQINTLIKNRTADFVSVYFRDLNNGPWIGINEHEEFSPSSLIKVPLMMAYYKLAENNPQILTQKLSTTKTDDLSSQNIKPETTLIPNQKYSIDELITQMIIYSDNLAYEILNDNIPNQDVIDVYSHLGVDISEGFSNPGGDILSVKSYASFFRILFNSSYLDNTMSEKALKLLAESSYTQGLVAGVGPQTVVAHKFGERQFLATGIKQLHDCGIVYLPQKPYLLCVMTRGKNFDKLAGSIRSISSTVYQNITQAN